MSTLSSKALAVIVAISLAFSFEIYLLIDKWLILDGSYSHGLLLFFYSGYLIFLASKDLKPSKGSSLALLGGAVCILIWAVSRLLFIEVAAQAMWPVILLAVIAALFGWNNMWRMFIPIALLILAVPIWDYIGYPLQLITVFVDQFLLGAAGITFEINGIYVHLPGKGTFEVAFGCSGLRYLLISVALSMIIAQQWLSSLSSKVKIIAMGIFLGLASNWLRVAIIIYIGDMTYMESPLVDDHETFGWVLFSLMMLPLIWFGNKLEAGESASTPTPSSSALGQGNNGLTITVVLISLVLGGWLMVQTKASSTKTAEAELFSLSGWSQLPIALANELGIFFNRPDIIRHSSYYRQDGANLIRLDGFVYQFNSQRTGQELIQSGNRFYDGDRYAVESSSIIEKRWEYLVLRDRVLGKRLHLWISYITDGQFTADKLEVKLSLLSQSFKSDTRVAATAWLLDCGGCDKAELPLDMLMQQSLNALSTPI